ncbi:MAG: hypothetical protein QHJ73_19115, partial [Armatimonadota bacterium]|nr:hypothetical protein [Armatimonadota bacterium]
MMHHRVRFMGAFFSTALLWALMPGPANARTRHSAADLLAQLPARFEENLGQAAQPARFVYRSTGQLVLLSEAEVLFVLGGGAAGNSAREPVRVRLRWPNGRRARIAGEGPLPGPSHYLLGNRKTGWRRNVPAYAR